MWERKSADEVRRLERRARFDPRYALFMALFSGAMATLARSWGLLGGYGAPPLPPKPLIEAIDVFPFFFIVMFLGFYLARVFRRRPENPELEAMICDSCYEVTDSTTGAHCHCGGRRDLLSHWTWTPDHSASAARRAKSV